MSHADLHLNTHISKQFNAELDDIRQRVLTMGGLVEQQVSEAVRALTEADGELGEQVANRDYKVNAMEVGIDEECTRVLARRQPAATLTKRHIIRPGIPCGRRSIIGPWRKPLRGCV